MYPLRLTRYEKAFHALAAANDFQLFALSDDMLLGEMHSAADIYSPLFGSVIAFKSNAYSTVTPPTEQDAKRFGEKVLSFALWKHRIIADSHQ